MSAERKKTRQEPPNSGRSSPCSRPQPPTQPSARRCRGLSGVGLLDRLGAGATPLAANLSVVTAYKIEAQEHKKRATITQINKQEHICTR